jgi:hypothetical protein
MTWAILPYPEYKQALIELLASPSPRILAVVGGALLDQAMDRTLRGSERPKRVMVLLAGPPPPRPYRSERIQSTISEGRGSDE